MSFFITVVTRNLTYVLLFLSIVTDFCFVDSGGWRKIPLGFMLFLLLVFSGLIGRLGILGRSRYRNLSLRSVPALVFHCSLSLDFVCGGVGQLILLGDLLVGLSYVKTRL